jgi:hypothetical protein
LQRIYYFQTDFVCPSCAALRTDAAQRREPEAVINKLLTLRTRQAAIEARVRTMTAHDQEAIASKLEATQGQLRKLASNKSTFEETLSKASGKQLPIMQLLNQMVENLKPLF